MNKTLTILALSCFMVACSGSSGSGGGNPNDNKPGGSVFEQSTTGKWFGECGTFDNTPAMEMLILGGGKGSLTVLGFQKADCTGQATELRKNEFTYVVNSTRGDTSELTVRIKDQPEQKAQVRVVGDAMTVTDQQGTRNYQRPPGQGGGNPGGGNPGGGNPGGNPQNPGGAMAAFDAAAKGTWATDNCYQLNDGTGTAIIIIEITGGGKAVQMINTYNSQDCTGQPQPGNKTAVAYTVDSFANGQGELTLNGQTKASVLIQGTKMVIQDQQGTFQYSKVR